MPIETHIINYLQQQSKGVINLSLDHARHIVSMVTGITYEKTAFAKLSRYNGTTGIYEFIRTVNTTEPAIKHLVIVALETKPAMNFYMYECYNDEHEFEGKIFSISPNLFD